MSALIDNRYKLLRQLGAGGMGVVWEAEHTGVGRRVAVKLLHKELLTKESSLLGRLQREARLAGSLESPHIAAVLDTGVDPGTGSPYLVMEYLVGEDLQTLIARAGRLPHELALRIAAQACLGLKKAHEANIIHRDVKPANMFLARRDGEVTVKILDFGIAKLRADELTSLEQASLTRTGSLIGSPLFMSPEQARGMKTIDQRADVWSMGVVLFNMLTGRTPYDSIDALGELILAICSTASPSVRDFAPEVPISVAEIVQRALQISPDMRYQTVAEMYDAIAAAIEGPRTISAAQLDEYPEPPPGSRRFLPATPAGPSGTAMLPSSVPPPDSREGSNPVTPGSISMTISEPSLAGSTRTGRPSSGLTPVPPPESVPPPAADPSRLVTTAASRKDTPAETTSKSSTPKLVAAALAVSVGALGAWLLLSGGTGGAAANANVIGPAGSPPPSTSEPRQGSPTATTSPAIGTAEVVASAEVTPLASSPANTATAAPTASAAPTGAPPAPAKPTTITGKPAATGHPTAKPVDTSGFGDRK